MTGTEKLLKPRATGPRAYLASLMAELDRAAISSRLGESREHAGFTQEQMAELLHVHRRTIEDYESPRKHVVPFDRLEEWAKVTATTKEWLLHGQEVTRDQAELLELRELLGELRDLVEELAARRPASRKQV